MIQYTQMFGKEWKHDHKNFAERKVNMDRNAPIGVFDSGIGGLTVAREIMRQMPQERIVYFGDTARVPYGSKSQETVLRYSRQIIRFLKTQGVKAIVIACNTASACALETVRQEFDIPFIGVIYAGARTAAEATHNGKIGVIGTEATIRSGIYTREMQKLRPDIETLFLISDYRWLYISSTIVKTVASLGGDVRGLVPDHVLSCLRERFGFTHGEIEPVSLPPVPELSELARLQELEASLDRDTDK